MIKKFVWHILRRIPIAKRLIIVRERYINATRRNENSSPSNENVFSHIYENNMWNSDESRSGPGSELSDTVMIRKALPYIWKKYNIKTFLDVPCGDFNWMKEVDKTGIEYIGGDIVDGIVASNNKLYKTERIEFRKLDITKDAIPKVDMIFCRDCLVHLSFENINKALRNFAQSGCKYLMLTSYPLTIKNYDIPDGRFREINLFKAPFNLPKRHLHKVKEKSPRFSEIDRTMYLWDIGDIAKILPPNHA
jgi:hypothetical protein